MSSIRRLYVDFPWVFDALYPVIYNYSKDFACYDSLLKACGARRVLDLGCGTGLLARYLVEAGYNYTGVDISTDMLAIARRGVPTGHFLQCDMRDLSPLSAISEGGFDATLCTGRSFGHLTTDKDIRSCLVAVGTLLRVGGIFACDVVDAHEAYQNPVQRVTESTQVGSRVFRRDFVHTRVPSEGMVFDTKIHWRISEGERVIAEFDDGQRQRVFDQGEMAGFLSAAGLSGNLACTHFPHQPVILLASACKVEV